MRAARPVATVLSYTATFPCARMIGSPARNESSRSPERNAAGPEQSRISPADRRSGQHGTARDQPPEGMTQQYHRPALRQFGDDVGDDGAEPQRSVRALVVGSLGFELTGQIDGKRGEPARGQRVEDRTEVLLGSGVAG